MRPIAAGPLGHILSANSLSTRDKLVNKLDMAPVFIIIRRFVTILLILLSEASVAHL